MVLLTVVLMIALLGVLVMQYNYLSGLDAMMAIGARDSTEAFFLAQAGLNQAIRVLQEDKLADSEETGEEDATGGRQTAVSGEEDDSGYDGLDEDWALPQSWSELGRGEFIFKIVDEDRKFNINLILEDGVSEVAAARTLAAGGSGESEEEEDPEKRRPKEVIEKSREEARALERAESKLEDKEEKEEIEIDEESREYLAIQLLLGKVRDLADAADGIDPFARRLFDTPAGTLDAIVDWFEDKPPSGPDEFERSGPMETIGELAQLKGVPREMLVGYPRREEIEEESEEEGLVLIDPWAPKPFLGLRGYLTVYGDGKVNINTAPREILEVMLEDENDDQSSLAADVIAAREELPFEKVSDVNDDEYLREQILTKFMEKFKVTSEYFNILSEGRVGQVVDDEFRGTTVRIRAVVQRQDNRVVICYWRVEE
ncbi:MAG: type II secretion system protein GspK [Candidatus Erginobacter occultus]|nr:type II secretion system protein GspK [Candidatus Erginobacter occultus]